jgi:nucleotide-binding universal stress UspA family protein
MFKTILWASDGSETADRGLPYARELLAGREGKLIAVHCKEVFVGARGSGYPVVADEADVEEKIRGQVEEAREEGLDATFELVTGSAGSAAHVIADAARAHRADVVVVGTRGHAPIAGLLLGSVTQRLLHVASCPVLAVPPAAAIRHEERTPEAMVTAE